MPTAELPRDFMAELFALKARLAIVEQRSPLANTGMSVPGPGTTQVDGSLDIVGNLDVTGAATISGPTTVSGTNGIKSSNYVAGSAGWKFDGTSLEVSDGVVRNGALANPVSPNVANATGSNFALTTTFAEVAGMNVTVPVGYSQLLATVTGFAYALNPNTTGGSNTLGGDILWTYVGLGNQGSYVYGWGMSGNGGFTSSGAAVSLIYSGLTSGQTLRLATQAASGYQAIAANTSNKASVSATLLFLK